ncbi:endonuclease V [Halomarina litorea]|uniref:endonuclease V n=1 Tax=Halomarina litorea TaxID=2961595 RepID=UPI0020C39926|nr:endonuclease V [Halomarina sp. BCD28]
MDVPHPEFRPDPSMSRAEMEALQDDIAASARFEDDFPFDARAVCVGGDGPGEQSSFGDAAAFGGHEGDGGESDPPLVAGVDQAFLDERVVSAIVVLRGSEVVERTYAVSPMEFPYIPGLLSFREGGPILDAFETLETEPDVVFFDGSGRIHYRQAGLATHMGVALDVPSLGVAKNLLCGVPVEPTDELDAGERVAVEADDDVSAPAGTVIGYAVQTRQFDTSFRINPVYVSPGHRLSAETAADLVDRFRGGYKLPEPTRLADEYADAAKAEVAGDRA